MPPTIQDTLLDLFDRVRQDPDALPTVPIENWQEGSVEWNLLSGFQDMQEQVQLRMLQFKQMEQQLREKEEQYRAIFEATIDGLSINSLEDGRVIVANPALCSMFGYTYEEFIDLPPTATIHPDTYHVVAEVLQKVQEGGQFQTRFVGLRKDGSTFHAEGRGTPFIYNGKPHLLGSTRNISEQVEAERQLREKEEQYRSVFEATDDGLSINNLDGFFVEANPAYCRMLGYTHEELIGMHYSQTTFPEYYPVLEESAQAIEAGGQYQTQGLARRKDGSPLPVEAHATPFIYRGKPHMLGVMRDITERVQAEEQLREKEEQYRSIFEAVTDSLTISRLEDGQVVEANPATCKMIGYSYEELIGKSPAELVPPDYLPVVAEGLQTLRGGGRNDLLMLTLRKDGTSFPTEVHSTLFNYKGKPHLLTVSRDITERVQTEEQLREKEEQYRSIFEASADGLLIVDLEDSRLAEVNPAACRMYGYTREDFLGRPIGLSDDTQQTPVHALDVIKAGGHFQLRDIATGKDGKSFYAEAHATPFTYKGRPHMLEIVRDITEQVQAEEQLREKEEQYRSVFEATSDGLIIRDMDGYVVEANPAACSMHGYTYEEFIGLHRTDIIDPGDHTMVAEYMKAIQAGRSFRGQAVDVRKDGTVFPVEVRGSTFTYLGKPHTLSVLRDITERVEAEKQLREKEEQYRSVFEASTDGLFIQVPEDGRVVEVNPAACKMHGFTREEFLGLLPAAFIDTDSFPLVRDSLQTIQEGGQYYARGIAKHKDGTPFNAEAHVTKFTYKDSPHLLSIVRNITEQVQAEEQLHEKEEQYRGIFEASTDGLLILDLEDSHVVEVNPMACQMWGYTHGEMLGRPIGISDETQQIPIHAIDVIKAGGQFQMRDITSRKDGTSFHVEVHATPFTYKAKPHLLAIVRDITERIEAEKQLREREEQYRSVFEATGDGLYVFDLDDRVVEANPAACRQLGYTYEEIIGLHRSAIVHPDYHSLVPEYLRVIQMGDQFQGRAIDVRKDGTTFPVEVLGRAFTYKGHPHTLSVVRDITKQMQAEEQLHEKEEQYRSIFEATYDAVFIYDLDGILVEVNPACCSMFGYVREELIGLHVSIMVPRERHSYVDEGLESLKDGGEYQTLAKCVRKDGTKFYAETHSTTFTYRGKPHALGVMRDTTEQVQAKKLLELRVEERTRELSSLLEISHTVASTLQLNPLLGLILDQLKLVVDYTGASILTVEGGNLVFLDSRSPIPEEQLTQLRFPLKNLRLIWKTITERESIIIQDVREDSPLAHAFRVALGELTETTFHFVRACMFIPLMLREQVIGMLVLTSSEEQAFTQHHASLALAVANQAAVAIENARLYAQAQALAAVEERQRLARELHDSVSQALYGISLGVHTARMQLDRDPKDLAESLDYVLELAEAALIEMRALIFELRPESLETEGLVIALTKQAAALHARQGMIVQLDLGEEPDLPIKVKQDLYRIAQEALHNTVKHARASKVVLRLEQLNNAVIMEIRDDGRGFDTTTSHPGHIGLHSMRERVTNLGGELKIESAPGKGTCINAQVPVQTATNNTGNVTA